MATPIRKNPTVFPYRGKWRVTYVDPAGTTRTKAAESRQDAYSFLIHLGYLRSQGKDLYVESGGVTVGQWLETWLEQHSHDLRPKTVANHQSLTNRHLLPAFGQIALHEITVAQIETAYRSWINDKHLSPASVHRIHAILSVALKGAVRYGLITANPCDNVVLPRRNPKQPVVLTPQQTRDVLDAAKARGPRTHLRWLLALKYGLRQGEALALTYADFDLEQGTLTINKQVQRVTGQGFIITPPKSRNGNRTIPIDLEVISNIKLLDRTHTPHSLVFPSAGGNPQHSSTDRDEWIALLNTAGVPHIPLHGARHTSATAMIQHGIGARTVQIILGHSTPSFTLATYVHPDIDQVREELKKLI